MSYTPVVPVGGYAGWKFLSRTRAAQATAFTGSPSVQREESYFRTKIGSVRTANELVSDRRLLSVALRAFGLEGDIENKAFIRKVLSDGTLDPKALAHRLADKRYLELSKAFGFGDFSTPRTQLSDFADKILAAYETRSFEAAVGERNGDMRLALNAQRELATLAGKSTSADTKWFAIMGSPPLRKVFETAFGLPSRFAAIDIDQQLTVFKDRAQRFLGTSDPAALADPQKVEDLVRLFLLRSESTSSATSTGTGATALALLQPATGSSARLLRSLAK